MRGLTLHLGDRTVLEQVAFEVASGESLAITGASGSGKSSLLLCIAGLLVSDGGDVHVDGELVRAGHPDQSSRIRRDRLGLVFQTGELLPELSPLENVSLAGMLGGLGADESQDRAAWLLSTFGVPEGHRSVESFSGGEQQRVAVARALMNRPTALLADEPTGSLDPENRDSVCDALFAVPEAFGCGMVVVTHDPIVAARATRILHLTSGQLTSSPAAGQ